MPDAVFLTARGHYAMDEFVKPETLEKAEINGGLFSGKPDQTVYLLPEQMSQLNTAPDAAGTVDGATPATRKRSFWDKLFGGD